jgi:hypothetical protein
MRKYGKLFLVSTWIGASSPLWAGTGRPSDGLLSFVLLFGFLLLLWGILELAAFLKRRFHELWRDLY